MENVIEIHELTKKFGVTKVEAIVVANEYATLSRDGENALDAGETKIEIVVDDDKVDCVVANIRENAETGHPGDGRIFIIPVLESIRIRSEPGSEGQ